jgi:prepilin-type N-terminal cleavage/methylation domain-containing protein
MNNDNGFTLMEVMLSVAIILILGSLLVTASNTAMQGSSKSNKTVNTVETITRIDRYIRSSAEKTHIPYWANPSIYIDRFTSELYRSSFGSYINNIRIIYGSGRIPRAVEAVYTVNNNEVRTIALFSSITVLGRPQ